MNEQELIAEMLMIMETAINNGDWRVDGACDPDSTIDAAKDYLRGHGWTADGITGDYWFMEAM